METELLELKLRVAMIALEYLHCNRAIILLLKMDKKEELTTFLDFALHTKGFVQWKDSNLVEFIEKEGGN